MSGAENEDRADEIARLLVRVYEIHEIVIVETGGLPGLRDAALLHSAAARPFVTFGGEELYQSDFEKAAALFHSLIKNHPFLDGTKRTAFAAAVFFLDSGGHSIPKRFPLDEVIDFCVSIAEENLRKSSGEDLVDKASTKSRHGFESCWAVHTPWTGELDGTDRVPERCERRRV